MIIICWYLHVLNTNTQHCRHTHAHARAHTIDGAAKGLHAVSDTGLRCALGKTTLVVGSLDAGLLRWGKPTPFPNPTLGPVNTTGGASYVLFNNMYNTNYVFWWPFAEDPSVVHDSIKYRFTLQLQMA